MLNLHWSVIQYVMLFECFLRVSSGSVEPEKWGFVWAGMWYYYTVRDSSDLGSVTMSWIATTTWSNEGTTKNSGRHGRKTLHKICFFAVRFFSVDIILAINLVFVSLVCMVNQEHLYSTLFMVVCWPQPCSSHVDDTNQNWITIHLDLLS